MNQGYCSAVLALFSVLSFTVLTESRLQFSVPTDTLLQEFEDASINDHSLQTNSFEEDEGHSPNAAGRLRVALRALLELNDGELRSLLKGISPESLNKQVSPSTAFFLQASKRRLERLEAIVSDEKHLRHQGDFRIARRNKTKRHFLEGRRDLEGNGDADSLLGALTKLSESIENQRKKRKAQKKHKRNSYHSSTERKIHYRYWLKPEECSKSQDGFPRVHCPSPTERGEWICVEDGDLCDGQSHCPGNEDEEPMACLFFKTMQNYLDVLVSALLAPRRS